MGVHPPWHGIVVRRVNVHSGEVLAEPIPGKNDSVNFCAFLDQLDAVIDPALEVHVVLDNGSSHNSKYTRAWFAAHPRWVTHFTPPHASWINQVEMFFSILQRKVIRNGNFTSRDDLITKMLTFIADYDQKAKPFRWTYAADPLPHDPHATYFCAAPLVSCSSRDPRTLTGLTAEIDHLRTALTELASKVRTQEERLRRLEQPARRRTG